MVSLALSPLVIPAKSFTTAELVKPGSSLILLPSSESKSFHSPAASGSLFFVSSKKSKQKKDDPDVAFSASLRVRERMVGFARRTSLYVRERVRIVRTLLRTFPPCTRRDKGGPKIKSLDPL